MAPAAATEFYDYSGGLIHDEDGRLLKPGDLTSAVGGELRPGGNSIYSTGPRKNAGTLGAGEHVPGLLFAQHDAAASSRLVAGVGTGLFEVAPATSAMAGSAVTIDGATLAYASTPKALVGRQTAERLFVASGVGVNVVIDGDAFSPRRQNLVRKADGTWSLLSMLAPTDPPEVNRTALMQVDASRTVLSNSGWSNPNKSIDNYIGGPAGVSNDQSRASANATTPNPTRTIIVSFGAFTGNGHKIKVFHDTIGSGSTNPANVVGAGGSDATAGLSSMKVEYSLNAGSTWVTMSNKPTPYAPIWTEVAIPDLVYVATTTPGDRNVQVRTTLTFANATQVAVGRLYTVKCINAPAATQTAPLGFRYVITEWDDVNKEESAWSAESDPVSDSFSPQSTVTGWNIVTVKLPPGYATPGKRQNNRTTHWNVYRQPEGAALGEFDKYGLVAQIPILKGTALTVTGAVTSAGLIKLTVTAHGYATGARVVVASVGGVPAATGVWTITVTSANDFTLDGSTFAGTYTSGGTVQSLATEFVDTFEKPLTDVSRPTLDCLITGQGADRNFIPKAAPHALYKSIDIFKESVWGVPVDDPSNIYFSPPGEYHKRPSLYRIPARTTRNDAAVGVKTLDDIGLIFFPDWLKKITNLPLVIDGRFDPSGATEVSTTRGAAGPLAFDEFTMSQDDGTHWCAAADREGVYITNGNQVLPWTLNVTWGTLVNLGNDSDGLPYLARTMVRNNADKRRIEVYYVPAGATTVTRRLDFFYGEGKTAGESNLRPDGQPRIWGPQPSRARGMVTAIVAGQRQRFTSTDAIAASGRICWEDPDAYFADDSFAVDVSGTVTRTITTGDLPIAGLGQDGYLRSTAMRIISGAYHAIAETVSMEFSSGEKRTVTQTTLASAPDLFPVMAAGESLQHSFDDSGTTEKAVVLGIYVETRAWGKSAGGLRSAYNATAGTTSLPT